MYVAKLKNSLNALSVYKAISTNHLVFTLNKLKELTLGETSSNDESLVNSKDEEKTKYINTYFISNEAYKEVVETYKQDLVRDDKIHSIINNNTEFWR